ncbi:MAG: short-chain dehydrogenase [Acidobacteria bacterium]|jgi:gluconate 5-dehydrogenase|nr:short-chain dehydrogenase [Acidobacteriota bacterium]|tara:strand:- start:16451 stop:17236 length:786 start_codon:yes stop_codon:yes gene_type:complete
MSVTDIFRLDGKVAIIPGGGGGIGSRLAGALAEFGAKVTIVGRSNERSEVAAEKVRIAGSEALVVIGDVTTEEDASRCVTETLERFGRVDIIVNAIGGGAGDVLHAAHNYPRVAWDWIFELNVRSSLLPTQAAVRAMIDAGRGGRVLNISSVRGQLGIDAGYSAYVAAKGAIDALTRQQATEWARYGITVNAISPTFIDTPQVAILLNDPEFKAGIISRIPLARIGQADDLIGAVLLFCSDTSSFITGQILTIDGGLTATQ